MRYGSVCSGIEAASVAWHPLGWRASFLSEIDAFPRDVLAHHYPTTPLYGDFTTIQGGDYDAIDLLVGGTPCQSFSVAGLRAGLADPRGNLMLGFGSLASRLRPRWLVWENVPGVLSSDGGRDFGAFLGMLAILGYGFAYRILDAQFVRVDGFGRAVPQRRRRVLVVGYLGDWRRAAAVFLERASLRGDSAPSREAGQRIAATLTSGVGNGGAGHGARSGHAKDSTLISMCLNAKGGAGRLDAESETLIPTIGGGFDVAHALAFDVDPRRGRIGDVVPTLNATEQSSYVAGVLVPVHPYTLAIRGRGDSHELEYRQDGTSNALLCPNGGRGGIGVGAIAFDTTQITSATNRSNPQPGDPCHSLAKGAHAPAIAFDARQSDVIQYGDKTGPLDTDGQTIGIQQGMQVRRLTPRECERLQGFPDDYTAITRNGKPAADGPRYKALGNSMAVNCMRWIGRRIALVDGIQTMTEAA